MSPEKLKLIELEVAESLQEDIDKGIVRLPSNVMNELRLLSGMIVEIKAKESTVVKAMRSIKGDQNKRIITLDGTIRSNIGASIGDKIKLYKAKIQEAKKIT